MCALHGNSLSHLYVDECYSNTQCVCVRVCIWVCLCVCVFVCENVNVCMPMSMCISMCVGTQTYLHSLSAEGQGLSEGRALGWLACSDEVDL